jgi:3-hydroxy-9,10-secoandrosta-1,3,5(10)-triene-9,17-dione monooxygenase
MSRSASQAPTLDVLTDRARALIPTLRERAAETEALRRVPDETIRVCREAGLFRLYQPARYGGYELDVASTPLDVIAPLGTACASTAWVVGVISSHAWVVGLFPQAAQDAVWGADGARGDALVASAFSPLDGTARPVEGGFWLQGTWQFSSGVDAVDWVILSAPVRDPDAPRGGPPSMRMCLVPRSAFEILDTWYAAGLQGSGSKDVRVAGAFVPEALAVDLAAFNGRDNPGRTANPAYIYALPLRPALAYSTVAPAVGVARGTIEAVVAEHRARPERAALVPRQLRVAESLAEVNAAEALLRQDAAEIRRLGLAGEEQGVEPRARYRLHIAYAVQLCVRAVDRLVAVQGAHGIAAAHPVQRALRDVHGIASHGGLAWDAAASTYGKVAFGVELGPADRV